MTSGDSTTATVDWNHTLRDQLALHWEHLLRLRLSGLTDDEYLWEPASDVWTLRPRSTATAWKTAGAGMLVMEYATTTTADDALAQLDEQYARWTAGVASLGEDGLARPVDEAEGPWAQTPYAGLVLHVNRRLIYHGAEICLLRDLYLRKDAS